MMNILHNNLKYISNFPSNNSLLPGYSLIVEFLYFINRIVVIPYLINLFLLKMQASLVGGKIP